MRCAVERDLSIYMQELWEMDDWEEKAREAFWGCDGAKKLLSQGEKYRPMMQLYIDDFVCRNLFDEDLDFDADPYLFAEIREEVDG